MSNHQVSIDLRSEAGGVRLAIQRDGEGVKFILGDHLGSTSVTLNADGTLAGEHGYYPWGPIRFTAGDIETEYTFTGQYSDSVGSLLSFACGLPTLAIARH